MSVDKESTLRIFRGIRLHFTTERYNCTKYNFLSRAGVKYPKDINIYGDLGRRFHSKQDLIEFLVCVMSSSDISYPQIIVDGYDYYNSMFVEWKKRRLRGVSGLIEEFRKLCAYLISNKISLKKYIYSGIIYDDIINKKICPELFIILDNLFRIKDLNKSNNTIFFLYFRNALYKYSLILKFDYEKINGLILEELKLHKQTSLFS